MPSPVKLDIRKMLPVIRAAFDAKKLQMFKKEAQCKCLYSGPCAIGICLTPKQRERFDGGPPISNSLWGLQTDKKIISDHLEELGKLQRYHDTAATSSPKSKKQAIVNFELCLRELEKKFA